MSTTPSHGSDVQEAPDWWKASDGRFYPPELHPDYKKPAAPAAPVAPVARDTLGGARSTVDKAADTAAEAAATPAATPPVTPPVVDPRATMPAQPPSGPPVVPTNQTVIATPPGTHEGPGGITYTPAGDEPGPMSIGAETHMPPPSGPPGRPPGMPASPPGMPPAPGMPAPGMPAPGGPPASPPGMPPAPGAPSQFAGPDTPTMPQGPGGPGAPGMAPPGMAPAGGPMYQQPGAPGMTGPAKAVSGGAGLVAVLGGAAAIAGSLLRWGKGSVKGTGDLEKATIEVMGFDSNGLLTAICGGVLILCGVLFFMGIQKQLYWAIAAFLAGGAIVGAVVFSLIDIGDLSNRYAAEWQASGLASVGDVISTQTDIGLWAAGAGGVLGVLAAPFVNRN